MVAFTKILLGLAAASSTLAVQSLQVIWSSGQFQTAGGANSHSSGFAITDKDGNEFYSSSAPGDHDPCYNTGDGRTFTMSSTCWSSPRQFKCKASFDGSPKTCAVLDQGGNTINSGEGKGGFNFIGIAVAKDVSCGVGFVMEANESCDDKATWTVE